MSTIKINIDGVIIEVDKEDASKAIEAGELKVTSDELIILKKSDENVIYSKSEFEIFKTNLANEEHKSARIKTAEQLMKNIKDKSGLDFEGKIIKTLTGGVDFDKTSELFLNALTPKLEKKIGIEPNKKLEEAQNNFTTMQTNYSELETEFNTFKTGISEKELRTKKDNAILSYIPDKGLIVSPDIALIALRSKSNIDIDLIDGKQIPMLNGNVKKDEKTLEPVDIKDFINENLMTLNLIKKAEGGGNGSDDTGGGQATDYEKFVKEMKTQDVNVGSEKFGLEMNKRIDDKTLTI